MKIKKVQALPLIAPLAKARRTSAATLDFGYAAVVRVTASDGTAGIGECLARYAPRVWAQLVEEVLGPEIIGEDPFDVEWIWQHLYRGFGSFSGHSRGILLEAISGIDIALWDLMGKDTGKPIHKLLGGDRRTEINAYASSIGIDTERAMVDEARHLVQLGFRAVKVKIGRSVEEEVKTLRSIREAVGSDIDLMVDANGAYRYPDAVRLAQYLEGINIRWFEEPVVTEDRVSYAKIRQNSIIPLAAGEGEFTRYGVHELLETRAVEVIQPDVSRSGGITETRKIASLATIYNASYAPHVGASGAVCAAASVQLAASAPNFLVYECSYFDNPLKDELALEPVGLAANLKEGKLPVPDRPGLGIELNEKTVEKYLDR